MTREIRRGEPREHKSEMELRRDNQMFRSMARRQTEKAKVGEKDLRRAIAKFLRDGGRIEKLPEQKAVTHSRAGRDWGARELELDPLK